MGRKEKVKRSAEEKWEILQEGLKGGNIVEKCRKHGVAPNLWYRWRDEAEQGAKAALGGEALRAARTRSSPSASSNWSARWAANSWRSKS